jgi:hypothetical protein
MIILPPENMINMVKISQRYGQINQMLRQVIQEMWKVDA